MIRRLLSRLFRRQDGIALPVVLGSLTVVTGLAVTTFAVSVQGNHASARDRDSKRALGAAEAGLQMAILRVTEINPDPDKCVTTAAVPPDQMTGECPATTPQSIGNGASYTYVVSTPASGASCPTVPGFIENPVMDRCITSTGVANGIRRRLQLRFYFRPPFLPWGNAGMVGKNKVEIDQNGIVDSKVGTNGLVSLGNNSEIWQELLLPASAPPPEVGPHSFTGPIHEPRVAEWVFPEMDWETPRSGDHQNHLLSSIAGTAWNPTTKELILGNQQEITLPGGKYHLCGLSATNGNVITVPPGEFVQIFVDSPRGNGATPSAGCTGNTEYTGRFVVDNRTFMNAPQDREPQPEQLAMFVYGTTGDNSDNPADVDMNNKASFNGTIWAPDSTIDIKNSQKISGGFTAGSIKLKNNAEFSHDSSVENQALPGTAKAENLSWTECRRDPTVQGDPESGCS